MRGSCGRLKKVSASDTSITFPSSRNATRCARRLAWNTLCVTSTSVVWCSWLRCKNNFFDQANIIGIQVGGWLIQQQHFGLQDNRPGQRHALRFAARKVLRFLVGQLR